MYRPCPKCENSNHVSARVCQCGFQLIGTPKSAELRPELQRATAPAPTPSAPVREPSPIKRSPDLAVESSLPTPREAAEEMQKQAIRKALLAEELESRKPASGKLKINWRKSLVLASFAVVLGAVLAILGGFADLAENSEDQHDEKEQASLADKSLAPEARYSATNDSSGENNVTGKVVDVGSGDTITIADKDNQEYRIKLEGIDAPELEQNFGPEAQRNLFNLLLGKTVQVNLQEPGDDGFAVGKVWLNGKNVSLEQLKAGLAWHDKNIAFDQSDNDLYAHTETIPRKYGFGLWSAADPLPPWEYRGKERNPRQDENETAAGDLNGKISKAAPSAAAPQAETTIVQETENVNQSRTVSTESAAKPALIKSSPPNDSQAFIKSPPVVSVSPPPARQLLTPILTNFERNTVITVPRIVTARCGDGTLIYSTDRGKNCAGHGGVAKRLDGSTAPAKTSARPRKHEPAQQRGGCFVIERGKKVYLEPEICGN